jgi:SagB-type dehydrogenase family enzyme
MITRRRFLEGGLASLLAVQYSDLFEQAGTGRGGNVGREELSLRNSMAARRTVRSFSDKMLSRDRFIDLLWAAQGITDQARGLRAVPSAGALYPLEIFAFLGEQSVENMAMGVYRYRPGQADVVKVTEGDRRVELAKACLSQMWIARAPVSLAISSVYSRTMAKYGQRGIRYADIEAGCAAQNVFLMAVSLGLAAGIVGAFDDRKVRQLTGAGEDSTPLLVMPVGYRA